MNPRTQITGFLLVGGLIISMVALVVISSSQKELSISSSQAVTNDGLLSPSNTTSPADSPLPSLIRAGAQDVPLKVLGNSIENKEPSYLYTELSTKGIVGNNTSTSVGIYWLTEIAQHTLLRYGLEENKLMSHVDAITTVHIHEAKLTNLKANTLYYYTGHAPIIESFTTPPHLKTKLLTKKVTGTLVGGSGKCLIRGVLTRGTQTSNYIVSLTSNENWELAMNVARTADLSEYFEPVITDELVVDALCVSPQKKLYSGINIGKYGSFLSGPVAIKMHQEAGI